MTDIDGTVAAGFAVVRDEFAASFVRGDELGAAVCVYHHGCPVVDLWGGVADPSTDRAWQRDTAQVIYSATKSAVAACAHVLVQRGELDLEAPVSAYWPSFSTPAKVRWLLSHQAGLPVLDEPLSISDVLAWEPVVTALAAQRPAWEPGTRHGYHAMTYGWLVGEVVRRVSGRSLGTFFAEEIAKPLGLDFWIGRPPLDRVSRIVAPPASIDLATLPEPFKYMMRAVQVTSEPLDLNEPALLTAEIPAVNGVCTAHALARFYAALIGDVDGVRIIKDDTLDTATTEQANGIDAVLHSPTRPALGFGLPLPEMAWHAPTAFGFPGYGGSLGYADRASGIAFGYVMNRLHTDPTPDPRAENLVRAVQASLGT